jgi:hypothetical protein
MFNIDTSCAYSATMVMLINAPALMTHIIMLAISIAIAVGMVTAGTALGVIISQQIIAFQNSKVVARKF